MEYSLITWPGHGVKRKRAEKIKGARPQGERLK
jgi:hypothetical protein